MPDIHEILKSYWGYDSFRPLQEDIIQSVLDGRDTLGLMPTGGGKSLTFQVPALALEGVCIVVTPLIALMKDQVENLKKRGIKAAAVYSGMTSQEILQALEGAVYEAYRFLYVSPERLATPIFITKVKQMKVSLIAVDESHCISQWGYDFRPSYLKIAEIREFQPDAPILALTATATEEVVNDIQEKLLFKEKNVFRKSFHRSNLAYVVRSAEDKSEQLLKILNSVQGSSVVYVRNRKKTKEIADWLLEKGVSAEHFHAGLKNETKGARQDRWKNDETRVIVATNAFGMGIDKPNVRTVVHLDLPDSIEAYFQEAGRAGRDEKKAYAVLLFNKSDIAKMKKRVADSFPPKEKVKEVYEAVGNYYEVGYGSGLDRTFVFDLGDFCTSFRLPMLVAHNSIKILQQAGYLELTDEQDSSSTLMFRATKDDLYNQKHTDEQDRLISILLRSYTGLFTEVAAINEETIAKRLNWTREKVYNQLIGLSQEKIIKYIPRKKTPFLTFTHEREPLSRVYLGKEAYDDRKERYIKRVKSMVEYASDERVCRSLLLLNYFGERDGKPCGQCDICLKKKTKDLTNFEFQKIKNDLLKSLENSELVLKELLEKVKYKEQKVIQVIRFLMDDGTIFLNDCKKYFINK
ncbi:MAG: RecQ family ATP-dependent DNA helicase [Porphyromonadaceae bacterium]|nr:RecQ family ATP-dependent DNA helicase [Porphyromonadaceae bacterium]